MLIPVVFCQIADIRGIGIWKRDTWVESLAAYPSQIIHIIKFSAITQLAVRYLNLVLFFKIKIFQWILVILYFFHWSIYISC